MEAKKKEIRKPTLFTAVLPLIFMFVVLFTGLVIYSIDIKILLIICAAFTICVCMYQGHTWKDIEDEIVAKLAKAFPAIMILICVGLMIGAWVVSGTIPCIYRTSDHQPEIYYHHFLPCYCNPFCKYRYFLGSSRYSRSRSYQCGSRYGSTASGSCRCDRSRCILRR